MSTGALLVGASREPVVAGLVVLRDTFGIGAATATLAVLVVAGVVSLYVTTRRLRATSWLAGHLQPVTRALNLASAILLAIVVLPAIPAIPRWVASAAWHPDSDAHRQQTGSPPDVFLILLDGYPRADELEYVFGFDNAEFLTQLRQRGFDIDPLSHSNYTFTAATLTSLLKMDYVSEQTSFHTTRPELREELDKALMDGSGTQAIRDAGYELVTAAAGWEDVSMRAGVDRYIDRPELSELERYLLSRTWIPDLPLVPENWYFRELHSRVDGILGDAVDLAHERRDGPTFAFIHVPAPHLPLAFDADGGDVSFSSRRFIKYDPAGYGLPPTEYQRAYVASISSLNDRVLDTVDAISRASRRDAVIVLMSDHGYNALDDPRRREAVLHSFFAARTPGAPGLLDPSPTPVNLLRQLLGGYSTIDIGEPIRDRFFIMVVDGHRFAMSETPDPG